MNIARGTYKDYYIYKNKNDWSIRKEKTRNTIHFKTFDELRKFIEDSNKTLQGVSNEEN